MNIKSIKIKKFILDRQLSELIKNFEEETDCVIEEINKIQTACSVVITKIKVRNSRQNKRK